MPDSAGVAAALVGVDRGTVREATHAGHIAVVDQAGRLKAALGNPDRLTYFRSSAKPLQALAALRTGIPSRFGLELPHIAVMCASHSGEARHVAVVRELLERVGIPEAALQCGAHWPLHEPSAAALRREMPVPLAVHNNCSGKHAGMLAAARALDAPLDGYLDPEHPVQARIGGVIVEYTAVPSERLAHGVDGCSAPNAAVPLRGMARAFAALVGASAPDAARIVEAMTTHPYLVGGTDRFDTRLMEVTRGRLVVKGGAAGLHCSADRRSGGALAVKLESGDGTWIGAAVLAAMTQLGWLDDHEAAALASFRHPALRNHRGREVGQVRPLFELP